jgi:hypothetical protein
LTVADRPKPEIQSRETPAPKLTLRQPGASLLPTQIASANIAEESQGGNDMAKGMFDGVLGREEEKTAPTKAGPEALVAALAADTVNQKPEVAQER